MNIIKQPAKVTAVESHQIWVEIDRKEGCIGCQLKSACGMNSCKEEQVGIFTDQYELFEVDEVVSVQITQQKGFLALFLGYILPLLVGLLTMIFTQTLNCSELVVGLSTLAMIVIYYLVLFLFKGKVSQKFTLKVEKLEPDSATI